MKKWEFVEYLNLVSPRIKSRLPVGRQVSRFLLLISPVTLETSFLNSTFKIQRSAFLPIVLRLPAEGRYLVFLIFHFISLSTSASVYLGAPPFCVAT